MKRLLPPLGFAAAAIVAFAAMTAALPADAGHVRAPADALDVALGDGGPALPDSDGDLAGYSSELPLPTLPPLVAPEPPPAPTQRPASLVLRVPVLMYHYISAVPAEQASNRYAVDLRVPADLFDQHLAYLRSQGYTSVTAPALWEALNGRAGLPPKPVMLTFDDGYADAYTDALPLLLRYGFRGTFFITVNLIARPGYLNWDQVRALDRAGMDVESHAMDHKPMTGFSLSGLAYQMGEARKALAKQLGRDVRFFAYPSGDYNATAVQAVASNGYYAAFAKSGGSLQSLDWAFALHRSRVGGYAGVDGLQVALGR